jgi:ribosomal protein S18 acetylase RimI-like enzyme
VKRFQVHPAVQKQGIGNALMTEATNVAQKLGLEQLHLCVRGGTGTESFYERHGYRAVARIPGSIRVGPNDDRDEIYMILNLGE